MIKLFNSLRLNETGAAAAEYALILAVVGGGIAGAALILGQDISAAMTRASGYITAILPAAT